MNWTQIPGLEAGYEAREDGLIRSIRPWGKQPIPRMVALHPLRGYITFHAFDLHHKYGTKMVHRIIAQTFIPNPNNLPEINHKNCDKGDNRVENLEWVSRAQNVHHAITNGRVGFGEKSPHAKLSDAQVAEARKRVLELGHTNQKVADDLGVSSCLISMIAGGYRNRSTGFSGSNSAAKSYAVAKVPRALGRKPRSAEGRVILKQVHNPLIGASIPLPEVVKGTEVGSSGNSGDLLAEGRNVD